MIGYNLKIQEFHNGEVKFSIYPEGINYVPDEFKSYLENERIERKLQESQDEYIYNPFTDKIEKLKEFESAEIEAQRKAHSQRVNLIMVIMVLLLLLKMNECVLRAQACQRAAHTTCTK